jgi:glycosyltransferase involved in cell wall biosynthesis
MKIAILTGGFPSPDNPSKSIFNYRAAKGLSKHAKVEVFQFRFWKPGRSFLSTADYDGIKVTSLALPWVPVDLPMLNALNLRFWGKWAKNLLKNRLDDVDIIHSIGLETAPVAAEVSKATKKKHVAQTIGSDALIYLPQKEKYFNVKDWTKHTSCVICNSNFLKTHIAEKYPSVRAETAYRGTNLSNFLSKELTKKTPLKFLYLGGFSNRKGSGYGSDLKGGEALKEIWEFFDKKPDLSYTLCLGGPESDSETQKKWREELQNPERIELLGLLSPDKVPGLMQKSAVVIIPSKSEGLPNVGVEASAAGALLVASNVGGIPEVVVDNETGILLDPYELEAWKKTFYDIIKDYNAYTDIRHAAQKNVKENFDAEDYPIRLLNIYKSTIEQ